MAKAVLVLIHLFDNGWLRYYFEGTVYLNSGKNLIAKSSADHLCQPKYSNIYHQHFWAVASLPVCICGEDALEESLPPDSDVLFFHEDCHLQFLSFG